MIKKLGLVLFVALVITALSAGVAFANFGPHGGYLQDTDSCAACHRAHTSYNPATFTNNGGAQSSALLIGSASSITNFCLECHGSSTPGASTDVYDGKFDAGPSDDIAHTNSTANAAGTPYVTDSVFGATLNGGLFDPTKATSSHNMSTNNQVPMWGSYAGAADSPQTSWTNFSCTDCHDPHGSSNYRLLRDQVNGGTVVGGYSKANADPWVISNEEGYPQGGFLKGDAGAAQMAAYTPDYTTQHIVGSVGAAKSLSTWCAGCHTAYAQMNDANPVVIDGVQNTHTKYSYNAGGTDYENGVGDVARHRHPVNVAVASGPANGGVLFVDPIYSNNLPLEMPALAPGAARTAIVGKINDGATDGNVVTSGVIGCLTCHFAHGTTVTMKGWASAQLGPAAATGSSLNGNVGGVGDVSAIPVQVAPQAGTQVESGRTGNTPASGVNPGFSSALLRTNNRGVCERCHDK